MTIVGALKRRVLRWLQLSTATHQRLLERQLVLQAAMLSRMGDRNPPLSDLSDVEFSAFSQWGEDGVIDWLISRLPDVPQTFVEFGVEDYRESNTRLLLQLRNWRGLVMDGSEAHIQDIRSQEIYWRHGLTAKCAFIDRDNINDLLRQGGMEGDIGLLSVDIDGNDFWVWQAIDAVSPAIVVCEYNAVFGDLHPVTVPYRADFQRTRAHHSNLYFGASLRALIELGQEKGYTFVGTTSTGCNAFFVRNDFTPMVTASVSGPWAFPSQVREARDERSNLLFLDGEARAALIGDMQLVDLHSGKATTLRSYQGLYSPEWKAGRRVLA
jgi:hypothetical protein